MVGRGQNRRAPAGNGKDATAMLRRLKHQMSGFKFTPAEHPKTFVEAPWNSWTFERTAVTTSTALGLEIAVKDIQDQIRTKCAISETGNQLLIKVQSAVGWVTAASLVYPDITAVYYELSSVSPAGKQSIRSRQRDKGTLNMPAKAGYSYPMSDQKEILGNDDVATVIAGFIADTAGSIITARVSVLWQSTN